MRPPDPFDDWWSEHFFRSNPDFMMQHTQLQGKRE
jgi:hypothetical protein